MNARSSLFLVAALQLCACKSTTGSDLVSFAGSAGGPEGISPGSSFLTGSGWNVQLERARFHLGAIYLNENVPVSGNAEQPCILNGIYVAQLFGPLDLDLLSPQLVPFPAAGQATQTEARTAEVWLLEGDINRTDDSTVVLDLAGTAEKDSVSYPFTAAVTIGENRAEPPPNLAMPGANPICHKRIVTPIAVEILPIQGGALSMRVDPRGMLNGLDFSLLEKVADDAYVIPDESGGIGGALFSGLRASFGVYDLSWR